MPVEFWLAVHQVADAYRAEGTSPQERLCSVQTTLEQMPEATRKEVLGDLAFIAVHLPEVFFAMANQGQSSRGMAKPLPR